MANIAFKRGSAANLPLSSGGIDGSFYFTTDTHKLYLKDPSQDKLVDLTRWINCVATLNDLPANAAVGDVVYVSGTSDAPLNILCYKNSTGSALSTWTQINADTTLDRTSTTVLSVSSITSGISVATDIKDTRGNESSGSFSILGGRNVTVSQENGIITIDAENDTTDHKYTLSTVNGDTNKGRIKLEEKLGNSVTSSYFADIVGSGAAVVTSNASGITVAVPENINTALAFDSNGVLSAEASLTTSTATNTSVTPSIVYGSAAHTTANVAASTSTAKFNSSGVLNLDVYTVGQVNSIIENYMRAADAMTYKGTVDGATSASKLTSGANVGDTYKVSQDFDTYKAGDLLIAQGTDGNVTWERIESGDSQVLSGDVTSAGFALNDGVSGNNIINITLASSTATDRANIEVSASNVTSSSATYTFSHGSAGTGVAVTATAATTATTLSAASSAGSGTITIPVMTALSKDAVGHVTTATIQNYVITDTHNKLTSSDIETSVTNNQANIQYELYDTDNNAPLVMNVGLITNNDSSVQYTTGTTSAGAPAVSIDFVWGTF